MSKSKDVYENYLKAKNEFYKNYFPRLSGIRKASIIDARESEWFISRDSFFVFDIQTLEEIILSPWHNCNCSLCIPKIREFISKVFNYSLKIYRNKNLEDVGIFLPCRNNLYLLKANREIKDKELISRYFNNLRERGLMHVE